MKKYIYIAGGTPRSQSLTTSVSGDDQKFVITDAGFGLTVADINSDQDENIFKNGAIVVDLLVHANHAGNFGSHYGTPTAGTKVRIHPNALTYDGTSKIIVAAKSADAVYGITMSDTEGDNHIDVIQKQPLAFVEGSSLRSRLAHASLHHSPCSPSSCWPGMLPSSLLRTCWELQYRPHQEQLEL